jgi:Alpha 1,4-glycosyltransferase conserved region
MPTHHFQSFWLQPRLTPLEDLCISSFIAHGHRFTLYSYNEIERVPEGCVLEDARTVLPEDAVFGYRTGPVVGSPAAFANLFRYKLLLDRGGWWVDTDTLCLTDDIRDTEYVFVRGHDMVYANGIVRVPAGSEFAAKAFERAAAQGKDVEWLGNGPTLFTELIAEMGLEAATWPTSDFLPLGWDEAIAVFDPQRADEVAGRVGNSTFHHLWNQMLMMYNILKTVRPPKDSYLERMYARYDIDFPTAPQYEWSNLAHQAYLQSEHWRLYGEVDRLQQELRDRSDEPTPRSRGWWLRKLLTTASNR